MRLANGKRWVAGLLGLALVMSAACSAGPTQTTAPTAAAAVVTEPPAGAATQAPAVEIDAAIAAKVNLNTATPAELSAEVPGLGSRMVREFLEYRPYVSIQQFRREIGKYVDEAQVSEYELYVYVPIEVNDADAETLQQVPGLDAAEAAALIAARPFASNEAFLAQLSAYVTESELAEAGAYLAAS